MCKVKTSRHNEDQERHAMHARYRRRWEEEAGRTQDRAQKRLTNLLRPWGVVGWAASPSKATRPHTNWSRGSLSKIALMKGDSVACTTMLQLDVSMQHYPCIESMQAQASRLNKLEIDCIKMHHSKECI